MAVYCVNRSRFIIRMSCVNSVSISVNFQSLFELNLFIIINYFLFFRCLSTELIQCFFLFIFPFISFRIILAYFTRKFNNFLISIPKIIFASLNVGHLTNWPNYLPALTYYMKKSRFFEILMLAMFFWNRSMVF